MIGILNFLQDDLKIQIRRILYKLVLKFFTGRYNIFSQRDLKIHDSKF